jgi:hypothetical protein
MTAPQTTPAWERRANRTTSAMRAVGGKLKVTGDTISFSPHAFDRALAATDWSVPLSQVASFEVEGVNLSQPFGGGLRKRLAVVTSDGQRELFVVSKPADTARELSELVGVPQS